MVFVPKKEQFTCPQVIKSQWLLKNGVFSKEFNHMTQVAYNALTNSFS